MNNSSSFPSLGLLSDGDFAWEVMQRWRNTSKGQRFYCEPCRAMEGEGDNPGLKEEDCEYVSCTWCEVKLCFSTETVRPLEGRA